MPYTFTTLNDPQLPDSTCVTGINNNGQIVGYYGNPGGAIGQSTGFLDTGGNFTKRTRPGSDHTNPQSINDIGEIVGTYSTDQASGFDDVAEGCHLRQPCECDDRDAQGRNSGRM